MQCPRIRDGMAVMTIMTGSWPVAVEATDGMTGFADRVGVSQSFVRHCAVCPDNTSGDLAPRWPKVTARAANAAGSAGQVVAMTRFAAVEGGLGNGAVVAGDFRVKPRLAKGMVSFDVAVVAIVRTLLGLPH